MTGGEDTTMDQLTTTQAALKLGINPRSLQQLAQRGEIKAQKLGRDWYFDAEVVAAFRPPKRGRPRVANPVRRRAYHGDSG